MPTIVLPLADGRSFKFKRALCRRLIQTWNFLENPNKQRLLFVKVFNGLYNVSCVAVVVAVAVSAAIERQQLRQH